MEDCSIVLALCLSSFWITVVAIQKEGEGCLLYFVLYPTVPFRFLRSLLYSLLEGDCLKSLFSCLYVYVVICPNIYCSGCFSSPRSFYCLLVVKLQDVMVDKSVLQM